MSTTETYRDATFTREGRDAVEDAAAILERLLEQRLHRTPECSGCASLERRERVHALARIQRLRDVVARWDSNDATETTFDA